ncbi:MAG TPA: hypothetical protein VME43_03915 [Bryobacteraceae bacterium]|nr:hypothetical protein [Bryobacteraceae bacterium]
MNDTASTAQEKALRINLEAQRHGTFAEIGAGQEVARWFFHVGKASATVAKTISAYDMAISDGIYGPTEHYVSRSRLSAMLDHEYSRLLQRLSATRGEGKAFFVFADTVATNSSSLRNAGHGWLGVRFQPQPGAEPSEIICHIEMLERRVVNQQEAVGIAGVNLIYGAFYHLQDLNRMVGRLMDGLSRKRVEVDMIKFSGPAFPGLDNRLMSLQLVQQGLTDAAMFSADGDVVQPSEVLYHRPVLVERGSFRPITNVVKDVLDRAIEQLQEECKLQNPAILMEMTLNSLTAEGSIDHDDFLARVDILGALGYFAMISNYATFDRLIEYLRNYTQAMLGMAIGIPTLRQILEDKYYLDRSGGLLEGLGRLFSGAVKLLVYPTIDPGSSDLVTVGNLEVAGPLKHFYAYLCESGFIEAVQRFDASYLHLSPGDVLAKLQAGDPAWESLTPPKAVELIKKNGLFGYARSGPAKDKTH